MLTTLTPLLMILLACSFIVFALAYAFAVISAIGVNRKLGLLSLIVPFLAYYVCYTGGEKAAFPLKMGLWSLLGLLVFGVPVAVILKTHL